MNLLGERIYLSKFKQQTSNEIDLSGYPKGIYFVRQLTDDEENIHTEKIVIQ